MQVAALPLAPRPANAEIGLSVVIIAAEQSGTARVLNAYRSELDAIGLNYEVICMVNETMQDTVAALTSLAKNWPNLAIFVRRPWTGEDGELATAYRRARGRLVLTLPGWSEIAPDDLPKLFAAVENADMVVCNRDRQPVGAARLAFMQRSFRLLFDTSVSDVFCRVRLSRREVLDEIGGFGVRQHFTPVIAAERGYRVVEVQLRSAEPDPHHAPFVFKPIGHFRALLDAMTLFVVLKFLHRPLRFFGSVGLPVFLLGALFTIALVIGRLFLGAELADRPALIFSVLMIVLGIQIIALGLVGEIIIFASSRQIKQYKVSTIIRRDAESSKVRETPHAEDD